MYCYFLNVEALNIKKPSLWKICSHFLVLCFSFIGKLNIDITFRKTAPTFGMLPGLGKNGVWKASVEATAPIPTYIHHCPQQLQYLFCPHLRLILHFKHSVAIQVRIV